MSNGTQPAAPGLMVELEASGRHCHLTPQAVEALFGPGHRLTPAAWLSQPGQFASRERVAVQGPKGSLPSVVVLGPERDENQLELSATDALAIGIAAPVRHSGDFAGTPGALLTGPAGTFALPEGVVVAARHLHVAPEDAARHSLANGQVVDVRVCSPRGVTFHNVLVRVSPSYATRMHIDYDEANACGYTKGMRGLVIPVR